MNTSTEMVNTVQASSGSTLDSAATRGVSTRALATASCNKMKTTCDPWHVISNNAAL